MMRKWSTGKNVQPAIAVVLAVYNKPRELQMCLEGYRRQSIREPFQIILADDGSKPEIESIFREFAAQTRQPCTFLWQEDRGWGKLRMLNWAVLECRSNRIIFTDGDCVPHRHFIRAHASERGERVVRCGRRVDLMAPVADGLAPDDVKQGKLDSLAWLAGIIARDHVDFGQQGVYLPEPLAGWVNFFWRKGDITLLGSNFSIHKKWIFELDGFDESFKRPGYGEDTDIERRLRMLGLEFKWITHQAIQFHVWHKLTAVGEESKGTYERLKAAGNRAAVIGMPALRDALAKELRPSGNPS